jgi:hypothetical protein
VLFRNCVIPQLCYSAIVLFLQLCYSSIVLFRNCVIPQLCYSAIVLFRNCVIPQLCFCNCVIPHCNCVIPQLCYSAIVLRNYTIAELLYCGITILQSNIYISLKNFIGIFSDFSVTKQTKWSKRAKSKKILVFQKWSKNDMILNFKWPFLRSKIISYRGCKKWSERSSIFKILI